MKWGEVNSNINKSNDNVKIFFKNEDITIFVQGNGVVKFESAKDWNGEDWIIFKAEERNCLQKTLKPMGVNFCPQGCVI